jgi:hypothetical protein
MNSIFYAQNVVIRPEVVTVTWGSRMVVKNNSTRRMNVSPSTCYVHAIDENGMYHQTSFSGSNIISGRGSYSYTDSYSLNLDAGSSIIGFYVDFDSLNISPESATIGSITDFSVQFIYYDGNYSSTSYGLTGNGQLQPNKHTTDEFTYSLGPLPTSGNMMASEVIVNFNWSN